MNRIDPDGEREWPVNKYKGKSYRHNDNYHEYRGVRDNGSTRYHQGVDINIGSGSDDLGAPVYATHDGSVVLIQRYTDDNNAGGTRIRIQSKDKIVETSYMHLQDISDGIEMGTIVSEGQQIGTIGGSGKGKEMEYIPHLHYELIINGEHCDPTYGDKHLVDPQMLLKYKTDYRIYQGGVLPEVYIYEQRKPNMLESYLLPF